MKRIRQWVRNQKLHKKIVYIVAGTCLLVMLVCFGMQQFVYKAYNELMYEKTAQVFMSYSRQVEMVIKELNVLSLSIIGDSGIQENLMTVRDTPAMSEKWRNSVAEINGQLMMYFLNDDIVIDYGIYARDILLHTGGKLQQENVEVLVEKAQDAGGSMLIVLSVDKVYMVRQIRQIKNYEFTDLGTLIAELDIQKILKDNSRVYEKAGVEADLSVFVEDTCIYADDASITPLEKDGWEIVEDNFVVQCTAAGEWKFVFYTPYGEILNFIRIVIFRTVALSAVIVVGILMVCQYVLMRIFRQLEKLVIKFNAYSEGILPAEEDMLEYRERKDEIGYLNRQFEEMVYKHKALEEEKIQRIQVQKEAEYKHLQQQIRPHFIFNTLSQIMWMAYQHGDKEIAELTDALSKLIRGSMTFNEKTVTARQELKLVENYMHIQMVRYEKRISFRMEVPEEMLDVLIPQMTIQPVVENAITYAVEESLDLCVITVSGRVEVDKAIFVVEDNGPGIDPDILQRLTSGEKKAKGNGIGLLNVQKRIQLAYSEQYGLSFHRIEGHTQVWITVPFTGGAVTS